MRRRESLSLGGTATAARPLAARGQQAERMRRIGVLLPAAADETRPYLARGVPAGAGALGLDHRPQLRIDTRWATANAAEVRKHAAELATLAPDVVLAHGASSVAALLQVTSTVPIVFPVAVDPVGAGIVDSLARPGGNVTGLRRVRIQPGRKMARVAQADRAGHDASGDPSRSTNPGGPALFGIIQAVAPSLRVEVNSVNMRDAGEIQRAVGAFARSSIGGLITAPNPFATVHRDLITMLAARTGCPRSTTIAPSSPPAA